MALPQQRVSNRISKCITIRSPQLVRAALLILMTALHIGICAASSNVSSLEVNVLSTSLTPTSNASHSITKSRPMWNSLYSTMAASPVENGEPSASCNISQCGKNYSLSENHKSVCRQLLLSLNISEDQIPQEEAFIHSKTYVMGNLSLSVENVSSIPRVYEDINCKKKVEKNIKVTHVTCALSIKFIQSPEYGKSLEAQQTAKVLLYLPGSPYVKELSLRNNSINNLSNNVFNNFKNLEVLDMSQNKLTILNLTEALFQNLTKLFLSSNKLQWMDSLPFKLTSLYIDHNNITNLSFISKFEHLSILDVSHNDITNISSGIVKNLRNLTCIFLNNNKIKDVAFLMNISLNKIYKIRLSNNEIQQVNIYFSNYSNLRHLEVDNNNISYFNFTGAKKLNYLNLCNNKISEIVPTHPLIGSFITHLKLCNNSLTNAAVIMLMTDLRYLDLSNNNLQNVHKMFVKTRGLQELWLKNVNLQSLDFVKDLTKLELLEVDDNNITQLPHDLFKTLTTFTISNNPLKRVYCPSNGQGKGALRQCKMPFKEQNEKIILDLTAMKGIEINNHMKCMLNSSSGKEFFNECSSCAGKQALKHFLLVTIISVLKLFNISEGI